MQQINLALGDILFSSKDLMRYEVIKETTNTYYACNFNGCASRITYIGKATAEQQFAEEFKETYIKALEQRISWEKAEIVSLKNHKKHCEEK